jgi:hypothetical protein
MNQKQKTIWWIDILLLISFPVTFFLDLTGLIIHQWIGIISITIAVFHLFLHRNWVKTVFKQIFRKRFGKARLYFVIDVTVLLGFALIGLTGLVMSTWLNLPLPNDDTWRQLHIAVSIATLVFILIKLVSHLRWFEQMIRKLLTGSVPAPARSVAVQSTNDNLNRMGRREFLLTIGVMSTASFVALASASKSLAKSITTNQTTDAEVDPSETIESTEATTQAAGTPEVAIQPTETVQAATQTPTVEETQSTPATSLPAESDCTVRCPRGCSYPGHCHRYVDANKNNLCDLGDCL